MKRISNSLNALPCRSKVMAISFHNLFSYDTEEEKNEKGCVFDSSIT